MDVVPPGVTTMEIAARHLRVGTRRMYDLATRTHLTDITPVPLGRSLGTYRLIPHLGVPLLRQALSPAPRRLSEWQEAVRDVLASGAWTRALAAIARRPAGGVRSDGSAVADLLLSPALRQTMDDLYHQ